MNCIAPKIGSSTILTFSLAEISNKVFKQWKLYVHLKSILLDKYLEFSVDYKTEGKKQFSKLS